MGWLRFVGSFKLYVSFAKEPYKRDYITHVNRIHISIHTSTEHTYHIWGGYDS